MIRAVFSKITGFFVLALVLLGTGIFIVTRLPIMMYPQTEQAQVRVSINHPGTSAVDFQDNYADFVEPRLLGLENLELIESSYASDQSSFNLTFDWGVDKKTALSDVESLLYSLNSGFPEELQDSYKVGSRQKENAGFLIVGIFSQEASPEDLYAQLSRNVEPRLNKVSDAEEVQFYNVEDLQVEIELKQQAMLAQGITIMDVDTALKRGLSPTPLGSLKEKGKNYSVRFTQNLEGLKDIENIVVKVKGSRSITLAEISHISIAYTLPSNLFMVGGEAVVQLTATPMDGGNINRMTDEIMAVMTNAREEGLLPGDTSFHLFLDPAKYINRAIANVVRSAIIGGALAILVVFLILGELKNTIIVAFSLPFSIIISFIFMYLFNVSLNLISLGGLALAVGMIVDSTIVVMENIHRLGLKKGAGDSPHSWRETVAAATDQVRGPVIASVLTSILVFLPISFTAPLTNAILGDQAKTVIFSLSTSLFAALYLVPVVAYTLYKPKAKPQKKDRKKTGKLPGFTRISVPAMNFLTQGYRRSLRFIIRRKSVALLLIVFAFGSLVLSVGFLLPQIPKEIISPPSSDRVILFFRNFVDYPDTESVMEKALPGIEERIKARVGDYVIQTYANIRGRFNILFIDLTSSDVTDFVVAELQNEFASSGNNYYNVLPWDPAELPLPRTSSLQISVYGPQEARKIALLEEIQDLLDDADLYTRVYSTPSSALSDELILSSREGIIAGFPGLTESFLNNLTRRILGGTSTLSLVEDDFDVNIEAYFPEEEIDSQKKLGNFLIPWNDKLVPLKHFFQFRTKQSVSEILAIDGEPTFRVYGNIFGKIPEKIRLEKEQEVEKILQEKLTLPEGYSWVLDNPQIEMEKSINSLFTALIISMALIYLLLSFQFNSLWIPLVILVSIPLGFIGVILSLLLFDSTLSLNSMLGTILLGGVVVNNAIILIDFWLKTRHDYADGLDALEGVAAIRFPPILITTLTTILGMLPIALGLGDGSNIIQPLGIAVSGGLLISTIFTLYIVPSLLSLSVKTNKENHRKVS